LRPRADFLCPSGFATVARTSFGKHKADFCCRANTNHSALCCVQGINFSCTNFSMGVVLDMMKSTFMIAHSNQHFIKPLLVPGSPVTAFSLTQSKGHIQKYFWVCPDF
jgi:hypothetical protein